MAIGLARCTQWLLSILAHHYGLDHGTDNEIIVLAGRLDQYLQEVFHHLDWRGDGTISGEVFCTLCGVLDLEPGMDECEGLLEQLPEHLTFRHFHAKLCRHFNAKAGALCLPGSQESKMNRRESPGMTLTEEDQELKKLEDENRHLWELLEDLRMALQSNDARCLALQVSQRIRGGTDSKGD
ncbi:EF-hand and coiled-coil domain-containing protein 1-like [Aquarana catesbeiana]|uniref:EF-hand and coiled-coil domain-containing protein 1-like n=1 Tax=Aquarana catesbeiana TaxID=8400 RepID=UPI003CCA1976